MCSVSMHKIAMNKGSLGKGNPQAKKYIKELAIGKVLPWVCLMKDWTSYFVVA